LNCESCIPKLAAIITLQCKELTGLKMPIPLREGNVFYADKFSVAVAA